MKLSSIIAITLCSALMVSAFDASAQRASRGVAYDIWVRPNGDVSSSVGGGTATNPGGTDAKEVVKAICKAANNNGDPLPKDEQANGKTKVHPPAAYKPAVPPGPDGPGTPEGWKDTPVTTLDKCCKKNSKTGEWEPKDPADAKCTEGLNTADSDKAGEMGVFYDTTSELQMLGL
ncbi:MAG: hypothetical protein AB7L92_01085 [Alphaproteobacteria bacterium]